MNTNKQLDITFLDNGEVKVETGDLSGPNHKAADEFVKLLQTLLGGSCEVEKIKHTHTHHHHHTKTEHKH